MSDKVKVFWDEINKKSNLGEYPRSKMEITEAADGLSENKILIEERTQAKSQLIRFLIIPIIVGLELLGLLICRCNLSRPLEQL